MVRCGFVYKVIYKSNIIVIDVNISTSKFIRHRSETNLEQKELILCFNDCLIMS